LIDAAVAAAVEDFLAARPTRPDGPADAEQVAELILNLLQQCQAADPGYGVLRAERVPPWKAATAACDVILRQQADGDATLGTGILVVTADRQASLANHLRRVANEPQPFDRLFVVAADGAELPGLDGTGEGQRCPVSIHERELAEAEYAELSALRAAARQARGGTLTAGGVRVTEAEVIASHHRQQHYLASGFLSAILFDPQPSGVPVRASAAAQ
jgi:hypothetical protein